MTTKEDLKQRLLNLSIDLEMDPITTAEFVSCHFESFDVSGEDAEFCVYCDNVAMAYRLKKVLQYRYGVVIEDQ